jgi:hypothetical protein
MSIPPGLPRHIDQRAVQPPGLPAGDFAWSIDEALAVLTVLEGSKIAVLQVDAYVVPYGQQEVIHTGRRIGFLYQLGERASDFARRSRLSAAEFINAGSRDESSCWCAPTRMTQKRVTARPQSGQGNNECAAELRGRVAEFACGRRR